MSSPTPATSDRRARLFRGAVACAALVWLGGPAWPEQIDDQLITLAFAHEWAASGLIRWSTGEIVEGSSSFLQLALATAWIALGGGDANLFVKVLAGVCGLGLVLYANARLPVRAAGTLLLAALVTWEPTARWSFVGMETTLFAALLTVGWTGVLAAAPGTVAGLGALWLAAAAHPEGNVHFALAALYALRTPGRGRAAAVAFGAALAAYHGLRLAAFGSLLPTPYLVKVASNPAFGEQWEKFGWDILTTSGIALALAAGFRARAVALVPFLVQAAVVLRAESDWMGHARLLLPGVWATAVVWGASAPLREAGARRVSPRLLAAAAVVTVAAFFEPPTAPIVRPIVRDARVLTSPRQWFRSGFDTTQLEDVARIVKGTPVGGAVLIEDVGMPGNVPGARIIDIVGLTDRTIARAALGERDAEVALETRFLAPPDRPVLVRRMIYEEGGAPRPIPWMRLPRPTHVTYPQGTALWYRLSDERPTPAQVAERWRVLHHRYPSQGPLAWYHAMTEAEQGRLPTAAAVADTMRRRLPADPLLEALPAALFAPFPMDEFSEPPRTLKQTSRVLSRHDAAGLDLVVGVEPFVDAGQLVRLSWSCGSAESVVATQGTIRAPLPAWSCDADEARLVVEALDGRPERALPTALFVGLGAR